ncbi:MULTISPECIES: type II toxin-antitoxin system VapC family toxin [unclassified Sphingomonas]|uniref:type II toxin-antitoxin system VapC family toxin n=1 Tax=Novosphingobium rhizosphaerae TaxID=1551649 RepID=UPI0015C7AC48
MSLVLDASIAVAWLFEDEHTPACRAVLTAVADDKAFVPSLWRLEVANVLRNAARRQRCTEAYVDAALARLARLPIAIDPETDQHAWNATLRLARRHGLTVYDAAYLELAQRLAVPLATADTALAQAARAEGTEVMGS